MGKKTDKTEEINKIGCGLTTVPTVDNTLGGCLEFIDGNCVVLDVHLPLFGIVAGDSLQVIFQKMNKVIHAQSAQIARLNKIINP